MRRFLIDRDIVKVVLLVAALNTGTAKFVTVNGSGGIHIRGIITTTGTGTFSIMHGHLVSGTSTVRIGSYLKVQRIA